jgi:L-rhamnose isomerase
MYPWQRWEEEMKHTTTDLERTSLEAHVDLCEMRYQALDQRLTKVETKLDEIKSDLTKFRLDFVKIMVGTAGTVVVSIIGAVATILVKVL